jgi:hypothetical protein
MPLAYFFSQIKFCQQKYGIFQKSALHILFYWSSIKKIDKTIGEYKLC